MAQTPWMIYGANGYSGELIAREAKRRGMTPTLAGRREENIRPLADSLGLPWKAFSLERVEEIVRAIEGNALVLHCAGPFSATSRPMVEACLRAKVSYLDITGEIEVFESIMSRDQEARDAGVVLLPGVGFDVVPSDCLAAMLAKKLPDAHRLTLAFTGARSSVGTTKTMVENLPKGGAMRLGGRIVSVPTVYDTKTISFTSGEKTCMMIPWGDVSTAYYSTKIPNISVYMAMPPRLISMAKVGQVFAPLLGLGPVQRFLKKQVEKRVKNPSEEERLSGKAELWGEVQNKEGQRHSGTMVVPNGYQTTILCSLACVEGILSGQVSKGALTPSLAFGAEFILKIPGVSADVK